MAEVTATITRAEVLADMKVKSHAEVAHIAEPRLRYLAELGSEKEQEANQCINDAIAEVRALLRPILTETAANGTDGYDTTATVVFTLTVTTRKSPGLGEALANAIHAYVVDSALDKYYLSVSQPDMAARHRNKMPTEMLEINNIVYRKKEPTLRSES